MTDVSGCIVCIKLNTEHFSWHSHHTIDPTIPSASVCSSPHQCTRVISPFLIWKQKTVSFLSPLLKKIPRVSSRKRPLTLFIVFITFSSAPMKYSSNTECQSERENLEWAARRRLFWGELIGLLSGGCSLHVERPESHWQSFVTY